MDRQGKGSYPSQSS